MSRTQYTPRIVRGTSEGRTMQKIKVDRRLMRRAIAAATCVAALLSQSQGFAEVPVNAGNGVSAVMGTATPSDPEKTARKIWHAVIRNTPVPGKGCFHVSYPNVAWESVECKVAKPRPYSPRANRTVPRPDAGNGTDDFAGIQGQGLITSAYGKFFVSGVEYESNQPTGLTPAGSNPIKGSNEYTLQINTNNNETAACGDYGTCYVWQQFVYATDPSGEASLFMQYWVNGWPNACPRGWYTGSTDQCFHNSKSVPVPNIPVTNLGDVILTASVENGGNDYVWLEYGDDSWVTSNTDSSSPCCEGGLDIASVWTQAEFNVFGDGDATQAQFNRGSQIIVVLALLDGSQSPGQCVYQSDNFEGGATQETNNMNLGNCEGGIGNVIDWYGCTANICEGREIYGPYIEFTETVPFPPIPTPICIVCGLEGTSQQEVKSNGTPNLD
jgi:hypothetical protein